MKKLMLLFLLLPLAFSCEKLVFPEDLASTDPQTNFDYLWDQCNEKYSYFTVKNIDWDAVYATYAPRIYPEMTSDSLFKVMAAMLRELRDDHTNLFSSFNISFFGTERLGPDNFDWRLVRENYLPENYYISGAFRHDFLNNTNREIGYIWFPAFTGAVGSSNMDFMLERYQDTRGLILDLRENGGGALSDVFGIISRFVEQRTLLNYSRIKSGPGHEEFSTAEAVYVDPYPGIRYDKKVALLVDRGTYSAGSFTALAARALPNVVIIGDTTGGGLGLPGGGQLPNGWTYRFSLTQTLDLDQNPEWENGVPPDIRALVDWSDLTKDEVIERALVELQ